MSRKNYAVKINKISRININWCAILMISYWLFAAIGSTITKDSDPYGAALIATFVTGFGYLIHRG